MDNYNLILKIYNKHVDYYITYKDRDINLATIVISYALVDTRNNFIPDSGMPGNSYSLEDAPKSVVDSWELGNSDIEILQLYGLYKHLLSDNPVTIDSIRKRYSEIQQIYNSKIEYYQWSNYYSDYICNLYGIEKL